MRLTKLVLISVFLLELYHSSNAIGIDSESHGLVYGGRVVRRYGMLGSDSKPLNKRYPPIRLRAVQDRAGKDPNPNQQNPPNQPNSAPQNTAPKNPPAAAPKDNSKNSPPAKATPDITAPKGKSGKTNTTSNQPKSSDDADTTTPNQDSSSDSNAADNGSAPTVATGSLSVPAVGGLAAIGGVFVLVAGLFAFSKRRKNKELTKNIVSTSAKAWEQQNSIYEKMEEETKPIGSYTVIATYTPTLADELDIQPGDKVTILVEFDDGWVQGINQTRGGGKGVFPRHCVDMDHTDKSSKRSSSMGGYTEKYTEVDLS